MSRGGRNFFYVCLLFSLSHQRTTRMRRAGRRPAAVLTPRSTRICRGRQAPRRQPWSGMSPACQGPQGGHGGHGACSMPARRCQGAVWSVTVWTSSCQPMGCAGGGQTSSLRQRRGAGRPLACPVERLSCRSKQALRRHCAAWRARRGSAHARRRSRLAAASTAGPETGVRSPACLRQARCLASRQSGCTRLPAFWGLKEGATPPQT